MQLKCVNDFLLYRAYRINQRLPTADISTYAYWAIRLWYIRDAIQRIDDTTAR